MYFRYNNIQIARQLLHDGADPNVQVTVVSILISNTIFSFLSEAPKTYSLGYLTLQDTMGMGLTPLHSAIYGYHASRVEETCQFIDELLSSGANAQIVNKVSSC